IWVANALNEAALGAGRAGYFVACARDRLAPFPEFGVGRDFPVCLRRRAVERSPVRSTALSRLAAVALVLGMRWTSAASVTRTRRITSARSSASFAWRW